MTTGDWIQAGSIIALVLVTIFYGLQTMRASNAAEKSVKVTEDMAKAAKAQAEATSQQAEASMKQTEIMVNAQFNAVAPVVQLDVKYTVRGDLHLSDNTVIKVGYRNIGTGPALNFRCWIEDPDNELRNVHKAVCQEAVATCDPPKEQSIYTGIKDYRFRTGYLRAQYESVFGKTYESSLHFQEKSLPELKYGEAEEAIKL